ncbi:MAG: porin family protein [Maribacter sp.]|nr:porin family protein [Maribacter sp.]NND80141.1 porin family protein [Maribacter sp.]NNK76876.1 porin family protein [Maribacter sp.]
MKKVVLAAALALVGLAVNAQEGFFGKVGLSNVTAKVDFLGASVSDSEMGFFAGVGYNFEVSDEFEVEPSVLFSFVQDLNSLYIPIMAKYKVADAFSIQAGPQINYLLEDVPQGEFGLDLAFGVGYNFTEQFFADARYAFEVSRDIEGFSLNTLQIGVGYRF